MLNFADSTNSGSSSDGGDDIIIPLAVTSVALVAVALVVAMLVGRFAEYINHRQAIRDDASDDSDYTRQLLKAQLLLAFNQSKQKAGVKLTAREAARKYSKVWRAKTARNKARRIKENKLNVADLEKGKVGSTKVTISIIMRFNSKSLGV